MRTGFIRRWAEVALAGSMALAAVLASWPAAAQHDPVAGRIGVTVAGLEWQLVRKERCASRVPLLQQRIDEAELDAEANAGLLASLYPRLESFQRCLADAPARIATLNDTLDALVLQFVATTRIAEAELEGRIATLHTLEGAHALVVYRLRSAQWELKRVQEAAAPDPARIAQKQAVVDSINSELAASEAAIAQANSDLADVEAELAAANRTGSAALSWATPTTRENGTPLAPGELGGYEIYVLSESTGESSVITLSDPLATNYSVDGLPPDTYHFSIAAYDLDGKFSQLSEVVSKAIP